MAGRTSDSYYLKAQNTNFSLLERAEGTHEVSLG